MQDRAMTAKEAAAFIGITLGHLYNMRTRNEGPPYFKIGNRVVYRLKEVILWMEGKRVDPEKEYDSQAG